MCNYGPSSLHRSSFSLSLSLFHLKRFPVGDGLVRRLHETEEEMSDEVFRSLGLKEEVHENLKPGEVDVLKRKEGNVNNFWG